MNEIIKVNEDTMTVSGRDLHEALEVSERFSAWADRQRAIFGDEITTVVLPTEVSNNGGVQIRNLEDFVVPVDNAKHICLMSRTEKGRVCRQYLIDLEKAWNTPEQIMARALRIADQTIANLTKTIEEQKPLVEFSNRVSQSSDTVDMGEMAKLISAEGMKIGRNRLIKWMKSENLLMENNNPYQRYVDAGYMKTVDCPKETPYGQRVFQKTVFTGKGQIWIVEKLRAAMK